MTNAKATISDGYGLMFLCGITLALIVFKLFGIIPWSWWLICSPALAVVIYLIALLVMLRALNRYEDA